MIKNIFTKSMKRQPVRTGLLILLLFVAAFSFVMRGMEYIIINEQINEIGEYYKPVGFLNIIGTGSPSRNDVRPASDIISNSPYVRFDDKRRNLEAVLLDIPNTDLAGNNRDWIGIGRTFSAPEDAFFSGTLRELRYNADEPYIVLRVDVDDVLVGYPEHVYAGQTLDIHYFLDVKEIETRKTAIDGMEVGERYFLRGVYYDSWISHESEIMVPFHDRFVLHTLCDITYDKVGDREISRDGVWYANAPYGEPLDLIITGLERLNEEIYWTRFAQSMLRLQTTVDMSYMPLMQPQRGVRCVLTEGRWVGKEDNELSRPVVAVHEAFASQRGLSIGDTLRIGIPQEQMMISGGSVGGENYLHIRNAGEVFAPFEYTLVLEIVGTFNFVNTVAAGVLASPYATTFIYIPDSVLPPHIGITEYDVSSGGSGEIVTITIEKGFISPIWYSFVLNNARDADAFAYENRETLGELGFSIEFLPGVENAITFWESANTVLQTIRFNLVLFSIVAVLVLILAVFLFIRQRSKDYAILRALGSTTQKTNRQLIFTLLLYALPSVIAGGAAGFFVALNEALKAMGALSNIEYIEVEMLWLPLLIAIVPACLLVLAWAGIIIRRRPVLEMLQGTRVKRV